MRESSEDSEEKRGSILWSQWMDGDVDRVAYRGHFHKPNLLRQETVDQSGDTGEDN